MKPKVPEPAAPEAMPDARAPLIVTGIVVSAAGRHEHDGTVYPPGAEISLPCELASELIAAGAVDFIRKEESPHDDA